MRCKYNRGTRDNRGVGGCAGYGRQGAVSLAGLVRVVVERKNEICKMPADIRCADSGRRGVDKGRGGYQNEAQGAYNDSHARVSNIGGAEGGQREGGTLCAGLPFCAVAGMGLVICKKGFRVIIRKNTRTKYGE